MQDKLALSPRGQGASRNILKATIWGLLQPGGSCPGRRRTAGLAGSGAHSLSTGDSLAGGGPAVARFQEGGQGQCSSGDRHPRQELSPGARLGQATKRGRTESGFQKPADLAGTEMPHHQARQDQQPAEGTVSQKPHTSP